MPTIKITDAAEEWITRADAKVHLRLDADQTAEDGLIDTLIKAVRLACEARCNRTLITTTWERVQDAFTDAVELPWPRVIAVSSVKYIDLDGVEQTLDPADYQLDKDSEPGWVVPAYEKAWPDTRDQANAVRVRYTAGYGADASAVPEDLKLWMKLQLAHFWKHREAAAAGGLQPLPYADALLDPHRVWWI